MEYTYNQLSRENFRFNTYGDNVLNDIKIPLAKAGFYYTSNGQKVKCFACLYEFDADKIKGVVDFVGYHYSYCFFIQNLRPARPKKFLSYDSLHYEKERLETFIEWPIPWILPEELAADGFYYLRTQDHCACVFCHGIIGAWEMGDTPRGEHRRHFSYCPFIRGQPVGNVTLNHSLILDKLPLDGEECPIPPPKIPDRSTIENCSTILGGRQMSGSYAECSK